MYVQGTKKKKGTWPSLQGIENQGEKFGFYSRYNWELQGNLIIKQYFGHKFAMSVRYQNVIHVRDTSSEETQSWISVCPCLNTFQKVDNG